MENPNKNIPRQFSRQAEPMAAAPAFRRPEVLEWIEQGVRSAPAQRVLDLACGPGIVCERLAALDIKTVGIDLTPAMVRLAKQRQQLTQKEHCDFAVADGARLPFVSGSFDQVVTRLSLHHFAALIAVLEEVHRVLRSGGRLIVADIVASAEESEAALQNAIEQLRDPSHVRMPSRSELKQMLTAARFRIVREDEFRQERGFKEWASIVAEPLRTEPLKHVMGALARAGVRAGMELHEEAGEPRFIHAWALVLADRE